MAVVMFPLCNLRRSSISTAQRTSWMG